MTLVNADTGEVVARCSPDEARALTERIRSTADALWALLLEAHERQAWKALGYGRWEDYVAAELDMSRSRSYQLLDQGRVVREIEAAVAEVVAVSTVVDTGITEREARDVKPHLAEVTEAIKDRLTGEAADAIDADRVAEIVADEVAKARVIAEQKKRDREELAALEDELQPEGFDRALNGEIVRQRGEIKRLCRDLANLGDPCEFVRRHMTYDPPITPNVIDLADAAFGWLDSFLAAMEAHR